MMLSPFQEWLNASVTGRKFRITSHPTTDLEEIDPAVLAAVAADARRLVSEGKTVVIMDTGGWIRTGAVVACLGCGVDDGVVTRRLPTGARAIVERSHRAFNHGALDATLNGLMMQSERPTDRKKRRIFPIGQQYPRPFNPARRLRSRLRYRSQFHRILISQRQFNRPPPRCHDLRPPVWAHATYIGVRESK
jgi:hypothetical protein